MFYVNSGGFTCGELMNATCHYMELAPKTWNGGAVDPKMGAILSGSTSVAGLAETAAEAVGRGAWNSRKMVSAWGPTGTYPALAADNYSSNYLGVTKSDWFIGSSGDLGAMAGVRDSLPSTYAYSADKYWPSNFNSAYCSNADGGSCGTSFAIGVGPGSTSSTAKPTSTAYSIRAIRAW